MKWVNGSWPVPPWCRLTRSERTVKLWEQSHSNDLFLFFLTGSEHSDAICYAFTAQSAFPFLELSAPNISVLKPDANQTNNNNRSLITCLTFVHQVPEVGEDWEGGKKNTGNKYPYEEITTSKCNSLVHVFLRKQLSSIWLWACSQHLLQKNRDIQIKINK